MKNNYLKVFKEWFAQADKSNGRGYNGFNPEWDIAPLTIHPIDYLFDFLYKQHKKVK